MSPCLGEGQGWFFRPLGRWEGGVQPCLGERQVSARSSQCRSPMNHDDRDLNHGATIIPLARPEAGHAGQISAKPPRLLDRVRADLRSRHYSPRTEKTYVAWIRRFVLFHSKRHPETMSEADIGGYLSHLANEAKVSAGTQNLALAALVFLLQNVLGRDRLRAAWDIIASLCAGK